MTHFDLKSTNFTNFYLTQIWWKKNRKHVININWWKRQVFRRIIFGIILQNKKTRFDLVWKSYALIILPDFLQIPDSFSVLLRKSKNVSYKVPTRYDLLLWIVKFNSTIGACVIRKSVHRQKKKNTYHCVKPILHSLLRPESKIDTTIIITIKRFDENIRDPKINKL